jgi:hypothetical protein
MFGIILPLNFFSPYKSVSIIEFWRRWHITLSRFLRDYLYFPLGGNRKGGGRRYLNLFLTMLVGGLWHGAGWPFGGWGGLHGFYLTMNHLWRKVLKLANLDLSGSKVYALTCWLLTFLAVVVSWVFFRSPSVDHAGRILYSMAGLNGVSLPSGIVARIDGLDVLLAKFGIGMNDFSGSDFVASSLYILFAAILAFFLPNVAQMFNSFKPVLYENKQSFIDEKKLGLMAWRLSFGWALVLSFFFLLGVLTLMQVSEFLYFQF